jgi:hypothetical protein
MRNFLLRSVSVVLAMLVTSAAVASAGDTPTPGGIERAHLVDILPLDGELFHVQGIDVDRKHIWVTSVDTTNRKGYLHQFDRATGRFQRRLDLSDGPRFHPGGMSISGATIWVAVAEYRPNSSAVLMAIDKDTMTVRRTIAVGDHLGCVAADGDKLVAGNWDSRALYVFSRSGKQVRVLPNSSATRYQDMKFAGGKLVASGYLTPRSGTIDWYAWPSMRLVSTRHVGATDRDLPYTGEGMTLKGRDLYLVPEDGPSRMFHYRLDD